MEDDVTVVLELHFIGVIDMLLVTSFFSSMTQIFPCFSDEMNANDSLPYDEGFLLGIHEIYNQHPMKVSLIKQEYLW